MAGSAARQERNDGFMASPRAAVAPRNEGRSAPGNEVERPPGGRPIRMHLERRGLAAVRALAGFRGGRCRRAPRTRAGSAGGVPGAQVAPLGSAAAMRDKILIGYGQGFWGDSILGPVRLVREGPLDYLSLDYLA